MRSNLSERSSSSDSWWGLMNTRLELQMLQVPGRPVYSVSIPLQVCLKILWTYLRRSRADILVP